MGVFYCAQCEGKVSSQLEACPHCGCPVITRTEMPEKQSRPAPKPGLPKGLVRCTGCGCLARESMGMCSQCGTLLSLDAEVSHLRNVQPPRTALHSSPLMAIKRKTSFLLKAGAVLLIVIVCIIIYADGPSSRSRKNEQIISKNKSNRYARKKIISKNKSNQYAKIRAREELYGNVDIAWAVSKILIKKHLKSPGTANFGGWLEQNANNCVMDMGNGEYGVQGWVDSQNGFGALIRSYFVMKVKYVGNDTYQIIYGPVIN